MLNYERKLPSRGSNWVGNGRSVLWREVKGASEGRPRLSKVRQGNKTRWREEMRGGCRLVR